MLYNNLVNKILRKEVNQFRKDYSVEELERKFEKEKERKKNDNKRHKTI